MKLVSYSFHHFKETLMRINKDYIKRLYKKQFSEYKLVWRNKHPNIPYYLIFASKQGDISRVESLGDILTMFVREYYVKENKLFWDQDKELEYHYKLNEGKYK